jgi:hypothetical protein
MNRLSLLRCSTLALLLAAACGSEPSASDDDDGRSGSATGTSTGQGGASNGAGGSGSGASGGAGGGAGFQCDPSGTFGAPVAYTPLATQDVSEPWISGDGLTLVVSASLPDFELGIAIGTRGSRDEDFTMTELVADDGLEVASQGGLSPDGNILWLMAEAAIFQATKSGNAFGMPAPADFELAPNTNYPEYPRQGGNSVYYSARETNARRSIYAYDLGGGSTDPVLFDAGDIFTYAVSSNGRFLMVTFSVSSGLETYFSERSSTDVPFPTPQHQPEFGSAIAATGITDDGCEVFGYDWAASDPQPDVYRSVRGR